jgi:alkanesulfonate monooxygenase SsuD/methylene tetrahydromethanopterin reductase-like flavin-dependent oxidoreductase (luciferase family)
MARSAKKVEFGWLLPAGHQRTPENARDYSTHVHQILEMIRGCFHSFWIPDHLMDGFSDIPEAFATVSYLAAKYPDLHLGTCVLGQSYRNPALLAKMAATLQMWCQGRFILGIGAGWKEDEYRAYGYEFPKASVRISQLAEAVQICKVMWNPSHPSASFSGQHYQVEEAVCLPKPQVPIPIMIGGGGEQLTLRVVARFADWWNLPGASAEVFAHKLTLLEGYCSELGRSSNEIRKTWMGTVSIAKTRHEAKLMMGNYPSWPGDVPLLGTPSEIQQQIQEYAQLGVDLFILRFADEPALRGIQFFQEHIVPNF